VICWMGVAGVVLAAGCQSPDDSNKPMDQSKIISVRPAIPDGARSFVEQQRKMEQERQRRSGTQAAQPLGYTYMEAPPQPKGSDGGSWLDIFNPAKWGKGGQDKGKQDKTQGQPSQAATSRPS
jgi:hypothetical protein